MLAYPRLQALSALTARALWSPYAPRDLGLKVSTAIEQMRRERKQLIKPVRTFVIAFNSFLHRRLKKNHITFHINNITVAFVLPPNDSGSSNQNKVNKKPKKVIHVLLELRTQHSLVKKRQDSQRVSQLWPY